MENNQKFDHARFTRLDRQAKAIHVINSGFNSIWLNGDYWVSKARQEGLLANLKPFQYKWLHKPTGKSGVSIVYCITHDVFEALIDAWNVAWSINPEREWVYESGLKNNLTIENFV